MVKRLDRVWPSLGCSPRTLVSSVSLDPYKHCIASSVMSVYMYLVHYINGNYNEFIGSIVATICNKNELYPSRRSGRDM